PTHRASTYGTFGLPIATVTPPARYFCTISTREKGGHDSSGRWGPSSTSTTARPASARRQAVIAPPGPEPITAIWARTRSSDMLAPARALQRERRPAEDHERLPEADEIPADPEPRAAPGEELAPAALRGQAVEGRAGHGHGDEVEDAGADHQRDAQVVRH